MQHETPSTPPSRSLSMSSPAPMTSSGHVIGGHDRSSLPLQILQQQQNKGAIASVNLPGPSAGCSSSSLGPGGAEKHGALSPGTLGRFTTCT